MASSVSNEADPLYAIFGSKEFNEAIELSEELAQRMRRPGPLRRLWRALLRRAERRADIERRDARMHKQRQYPAPFHGSLYP